MQRTTWRQRPQGCAVPPLSNPLLAWSVCLIEPRPDRFSLTLAVFELVKCTDGLLQIVSGVEHVLLERVGRPPTAFPKLNETGGVPWRAVFWTRQLDPFLPDQRQVCALRALSVAGLRK